MRFSFRPQVFLLTFAAWLSVGIVCAQQATVQGVITDSTSGRIPGAEIKVTNIATGTSQSVLTNDEGFYSIPFLTPGTYRLEVSLTGFSTARRENLKLDVDKTARVDVQLQVGELAQTVVQVNGMSTIMDTETSVVGQVIDNKRIVELPLNGRNYLELARLTAGVAPDTGSRTSDQGTFSAVGQHAYQTNILLDGIDNNSRASGGQLGYEAQGVTPSLDAVSEFKVVTNNNSAEYGFRMGGTVIVQTKSGTNQFHGSLHEFVRNEIFDGKNFFAGDEKPPYRRNQFGGTFGGHIVPDKLFFFGSFEGTRVRLGESNLSYVPTLAMRSGDFSGIKNKIYDPATTSGPSKSFTRQPFPGNQIPASQIDPVALKLISLYPEPNRQAEPGEYNYSYSGSNVADTNQYDSRIDWYASEKNRVFGRYSRREYSGVDPGPLPLPADGGLWQTTTLTSNNVVGNWNMVVSPTMFNEVRAGGTRTTSVLDIPWDENYNNKMGINGVPDLGDDNARGLAKFNPSGYAQLGSRGFWPNRNNLDFFQLSDHFTVVRSVHVLKTGIEFRREMVFRRAARNARGTMAFNGSFTVPDQNPPKGTGDSMADFLLGMASGGQMGNQNGETAVTRNYSLYFQDDWKIAPRLTLNLGVRWDRFGPPSFKDTPVSRFEFTPGDPTYHIVYPTDENDMGGVHDNNNFAPRIGLAFQATPKTVARLGFGIYYGEPDALTQDGDGKFANQPPEFTEITFSTDKIKPALIVSQGYPTGLLPTTEIKGNVTVRTAEKYQPSQYSQQWFLDLQRELPMETVLTVSYIGGATRHIAYTQNLNEAAPGIGGKAQDRRPWGNFTAINVRNAGGSASYNALAAKAEKRFSRGMTYLASYTWAHAIDDGAGVLDDGTLGAGSRTDKHREWHRGNSNYDMRQRFVTSLVYDLPFGHGRRLGGDWSGFTGALLGGWQLGGILKMQTGRPFSPTVNGDISGTQTSNYPNRIGNGTLPASQRSLSRWFDVDAFAKPDAGTFGDSGRNILLGPGFKSLDVKIGKNFYFGNERRLEFRCEMFNFTNTPNFGLPGPTSTELAQFTNINVATAGQIQTAYDPRHIQFGLKLVF